MPLVSRRDAFDDPAWLFELKLDGFRALAFVGRKGVRLISRNGHVFSKWPTLHKALRATIRRRAVVLDGEVVCLDGDGRPDFRALLFRRGEPHFYAFDLLWLDGDVRDQPLIARKRMLRKLLPRRDDVRYLDHIVERGRDLFAAVCEQDLEGIVAKHQRGLYDPDASSWWKVKNVAYSQARDRWELFEPRGRRPARPNKLPRASMERPNHATAP